MNAEEIGRLLAKCASYDRRKIGEAEVIAWLQALGGLQYRDCEAAVVGHYTDTTEWIMPAHVRKRVQAMRRERIDRAIPAAPPAEVADAPGRYQAELKRQIRQIADGRSMQRALEGPGVKAEPPQEIADVRAELGTSIERPGLLSPQEIAKRQAAESRAIRSEEDPPAKDSAA